MAGQNVEKGRILRNESARSIHFPNNDEKLEDLNSALHVVLEDIWNDKVTFQNLLMLFPGRLAAVRGAGGHTD